MVYKKAGKLKREEKYVYSLNFLRKLFAFSIVNMKLKWYNLNINFRRTKYDL